MLTLKEDSDGKLYHYEIRYNEETDEYSDEGGHWITDEQGNKIPEHICLCFAREPHECCCATSSWDNYVHDYE